ncbi:uncharacterized protein C8Q71DRAFT_857973 [Rhodofomes roseus]|uniref:Small EDRK-rich factor-like N-terminal domain-containing protein n=1 Tax=Rhodofomes roseus TaxID=34475 RepID=A0A4Y9YE34_9APHY|nr:uncharacterized protein C8Q71DRAFT_857973 [Rhodofomes roseus]KAH9836767.1 hypothetical protein C8Q71DRAFT_857973 [Rhodofomes roseus]TFY60595.1 hypothetical protein EVJ58_g5044 [Rhodofomes roseus]
MTRGNQRELAREKAAKKTAGKSKPKESGTSLQARKERDAEALRQKQKLKEEQKTGQDSGGANK